MASEDAALREQAPKIGAIATFTGLVRDFNDGDDQPLEQVSNLYLEHYPGMTEKVLENIVAEARERWEINCVRLIHSNLLTPNRMPTD